MSEETRRELLDVAARLEALAALRKNRLRWTGELRDRDVVRGQAEGLVEAAAYLRERAKGGGK